MILRKCTPIIPVSDLKHAGDWFKRCLDFGAQPVGDTMVHLSRDAVSIRLIQKAPDMEMDDPRRQQSIYVDLEDVDIFYATHGPELESGGEDHAPFDRPYGMREMHVIYESLLIYFGSPMKANTL
ncbi:MAG: hypothetical protein ABJL99_22265 [Aliishimia sp.]